MCSTQSLEPHLPPELERLIFECAVSENGARASAPLQLIAKRVREWIRPLIFRVMKLLLRKRSPNFIRFSQLLRSVGNYAQHLIIDRSYSEDFLRIFLSSFPNLRSLTIWAASGRVTKSLLPVLQEMPRLARLSANFRDSFYDDFLTGPFSNLTHLGILDFNGPDFNVVPWERHSWEGHWEVLTHLPKLTHIRIEHSIQNDILSNLLRLCLLLELLIMIPDAGARIRSGQHQIADNRCVMLRDLDVVDLIHDWEEGANGGVDTWVFCEKIVFARRRNYFLTSMPTLIPRSFNWEKYLNEDGRKWFLELRLNDLGGRRRR